MQKDVKVSMAQTAHRKAKLLAWHWGASLKDTLERSVEEGLQRVEQPEREAVKPAEAPRAVAAVGDEETPSVAELQAKVERLTAEQRTLRGQLAHANEQLDAERLARQEARDLAVEFILPKDKKRIQATKQQFFDRYEWLKSGYEAAMNEFRG